MRDVHCRLDDVNIYITWYDDHIAASIPHSYARKNTEMQLD